MSCYCYIRCAECISVWHCARVRVNEYTLCQQRDDPFKRRERKVDPRPMYIEFDCLPCARVYGKIMKKTTRADRLIYDFFLYWLAFYYHRTSIDKKLLFISRIYLLIYYIKGRYRVKENLEVSKKIRRLT